MNVSVATANESVDEMKAENSNLKKAVATLKDQVIDIQSRFIRNNLIFFGISEEELHFSKDLHFIKDKLRCKDEILCERVHRLKGKVKLDNEGKNCLNL